METWGGTTISLGAVAFLGIVAFLGVVGIVACEVYAGVNSKLRKQAPWAIRSLLLGIASVSFWTFCVLTGFPRSSWIFCAIAGAFAIWTGAQSKRRGENNGMATAGIILGIIGCTFVLLLIPIPSD